ncbi:MAG: EF-P beta-lysylation protein EpmB [Pirellulales bacterium]
MTTQGNWHDSLRRAIRDPIELCEKLGLDASWHEPARRAAELFPVFATLEYVSRITPGQPADPLLRQVLPLAEELQNTPGFTNDPVADEAAKLQPGILQKYAGRVLMVTTGACAIHCRYCFRRHYPYSESPRSAEAWQPALEQLAADSSIQEVLLSGGDPLTLVDAQLADIVERLARIRHLRRLRVHSRLPVVIPARVNDEMLAWLTASRLTPFFVVHINHPAEIDAAVEASLARLIHAGVPVLNQAVLLRGVNDDVETLAALSLRLVDLRVIPYYLNQLDRVAGAAHFEVPVEQGRVLMEQLRARLPGYAMPRYVQDVPGDQSKRVLW